jgi:ribosomal protein S13
MIRSQGKYFSKDELNRIVMLLRDSDMSLPEIADRMRCSRSAVAAINRKFQIRLYGGKRSQWTLNCAGQSADSSEGMDSRPVSLQEVASTGSYKAS